MNDKIKRKMKQTTSKLTDEEIAVQTYQKKAILKTTQEVDPTTGEILKETKIYNSEDKREKGTFCISSPEEIIKLAQQNKIRAFNTMLVYAIDNMNWNNEFTFDKKFIASYEKNISRFYKDKKYLLDNKYIFIKPFKKNIFTLNVQLCFRGSAKKQAELYEEQFGEEIDQDSKLELVKIKKRATKLAKEDMKNLINDLQKMYEKM